MEYLVYLAPIVIITIIGIVSLHKIKKNYLENIRYKTKKELDDELFQLYEEHRNDIEREKELHQFQIDEAERNCQAEIARIEQQRTAIIETKNALEQTIAQLSARKAEIDARIIERKSELDADIASQRAARITALDSELASLRELRLNQLEQSVAAKRAEYDKDLAAKLEWLETEKAKCDNELAALHQEVEDYRAKQAAISAEIMRRREIEEKQDFYRICLSDDAKQDIEILRSIRANLKCREKFDKLIYDNYIAKPTQEMVKRVLGGRAPSGIYKITRIKTGEVYIGKSSNAATRWASHTKTACGVEAVAHSMLHTIMEKDGVDQFTFELLEEVPKDKLTEREKYWITFYNSKEFGLNEKVG